MNPLLSQGVVKRELREARAGGGGENEVTRRSTAQPAPAPAIPARPAWSDEAPVRHVAFGLAQSAQAIDQALRLVHDQYVARGYMTAHPSGHG